MRGLLLRGKELAAAEDQAAQDPSTTPLQRQFLLASRKNETRRRKRSFIATIAGGTVMLVLAAMAFARASSAATQAADALSAGTEQAQQAQVVSTIAAKQVQTAQAASTQAVEEKEALEEEARRARAGELVAHSQNKMDTNIDLAYLLGIESFDSVENYLTRNNLRTLLQSHPRWLKIGREDIGTTVQSVAFSPDGRLIASGSGNGIILWDAETMLPVKETIQDQIRWVSTVAFNTDGKILASGNSDGDIILWDVETLQPIGAPLQTGEQVTSVAFSPDGKNSCFRWWHLECQPGIFTFRYRHNNFLGPGNHATHWRALAGTCKIG